MEKIASCHTSTWIKHAQDTCGCNCFSWRLNKYWIWTNVVFLFDHSNKTVLKLVLNIIMFWITLNTFNWILFDYFLKIFATNIWLLCIEIALSSSFSFKWLNGGIFEFIFLSFGSFEFLYSVSYRLYINFLILLYCYPQGDTLFKYFWAPQARTHERYVSFIFTLYTHVFLSSLFHSRCGFLFRGECNSAWTDIILSISIRR